MIIICFSFQSQTLFAQNISCESIFLSKKNLNDSELSDLFKAGNRQLRNLTNGLRIFDHTTTYRFRPSETLYSDNSTRLSLTVFRSMYNNLFKFLIFIPLHKDMPYGLSPAGKIFKKLWLNKDYVLTKSEEVLLKNLKLRKILMTKESDEASLYEVFQFRKDFINNHPKVLLYNKIQHRTAMAIWFIAIMTVLDWFFDIENGDSAVLDAQFFDQKSNKLKDNEIRIFNETVPFPHMAIEIDGIVYSYGQTNMSVTTVRDYIQELRIRRAIGANKIETDTLLQKSFKLTGLDNLDRVVQSSTLRLPISEKNKLKKYLIQQTSKHYRNFTLAHDCSTMVVKALKKSTNIQLPAIIDPSPSQVMMYLNVLKNLKIKNSENEILVGQISQIYVVDSEKFKNHNIRSIYINAMDTRVYWSTFYFNLTVRTLIELFHHSDYQYFNKETIAYFESQEKIWTRRFQNEKSENQWGMFETYAQQPNHNLQEKNYLFELITNYKDQEIRKLNEYLDSPDTQLIQILEFQTYKKLIEAEYSQLTLCLQKNICHF